MAGYARAFAVPLDPAPWRMVLGVALAQAAGVLVLAALYVLWRAKTGINPLDPSRARALVTPLEEGISAARTSGRFHISS